MIKSLLFRLPSWLREGIIVCPACDEFCSQCKEHEKTDNYIGDPDLDVPCSSCESLIWVSIVIVLFKTVLGLLSPMAYSDLTRAQ
ncbi:hypothetical protein OSTOST_15576 [Ostertagia ostertagi]